MAPFGWPRNKHPMLDRWVITGLACLSLVGAAWAVDAPEAASGFRAKPGWEFPKRAVASANPLASQAGLRILREGGSALDAAIAVQMVLALVEPQSSGLGGGAFLLHHDGQRMQAWDGRETAPAEATEDLFIVDGKPMGVAGLWEHWSKDGDSITSFTLLTVNANSHALMNRYGHNGNEKRMLAILNEGAWGAWLSAPIDKAREFMRAYPANLLLANPVQKK